MKMQIEILLSGIMLVIFPSVLQVQGDEVTYGVPEGTTCKQAFSVLTKRQLKRISECTTALKFKNGKEKNERKSCVMKCALKIEGILDQEGMPDPIGVFVFAENNVPIPDHPKFRSAIMTCFEYTQGIDPNELTCKSYDPMIKCGMALFTSFCNNS